MRYNHSNFALHIRDTKVFNKFENYNINSFFINVMF